MISISKSTFVLGLKRDCSLELYEITEKKGTVFIGTRRILKLPAIRPDTQIILEKFDETSSATGSPWDLRHPSEFPSRDPPSDSVLALYVKAGGQELLFSVLTSTLRDFTATIKKRTRFIPWKHRIGQIRGPIVVPWDKWGPGLTRWIDVEDMLWPSPTIPAPALSGTRCLISEGRAWRSTGRVCMVDFNPERLPRIEDYIKRRTGETERNWRVVTHPTTFLAGKAFKNNVKSRLPYYELRKPGDQNDHGFTFYADDKWVVLIRVRFKYYNVANIRLFSDISHEISRHSARISLISKMAISRHRDRISLIAIINLGPRAINEPFILPGQLGDQFGGESE